MYSMPARNDSRDVASAASKLGENALIYFLGVKNDACLFSKNFPGLYPRVILLGLPPRALIVGLQRN